MFKISIKNFWAHKRRFIGTSLAVLLGITFLAGTLVLSDTMRGSFGTLFNQVTKGTDARVRSSTKISAQGQTVRGDIDSSLLSKVRAVPGVAKAYPDVTGLGQIVGRDGKTLGGSGPPTFGTNWIGDPAVSAFHIVAGRAPRGLNEVVIDKKSSDDGHLPVGARTKVLTPDPVEVTVVGVAKFGDFDNAGGTTLAAFTLQGAEKYVIKKPNRLTAITVHAASGVSQQTITDRLNRVLPKSTQTITGKAYNKEQQDDIGKAFLDFFTRFLLVFACVALVVAIFTIYNTFTILVAQRGRESALLRAIGASRSQVLRSVVVETFFVGLLASILGCLAGIGVASGLKGIFGGGDLPGGLTIHPSSIIISIVVGVVVTVLAGLLPALRASRMPPLAALRDVAIDRSDTSRVRMGLGVGVTLLGLGVVLVSALGKGADIKVTGLGALLLLIGVIISGPIVARPVSRILGAPVARTRGIMGRLARQNAMRNPRRTASTASALMFGVAVVTLISVFGASVKSTVRQTVDKSFGGDLVVGPNNSFGPGNGFSPKLVTDVEKLPEVRAAVGLGNGQVEINGQGKFVGVSDPVALNKIIDLDVRQGSLASLGSTKLAVAQQYAKDHHYRLGTSIRVKFPDGVTQSLRVGAIYKSSQLAGNWVLPQAAWSPHATQETVSAVLIDLKANVALDTGRHAVERISDGYPGTKVQDRQQFTDSIAGNINQILTIIYVMLIFAIIIAGMGIANALSLSVYERTRELGLLRAVGETRRQTRTMVRWEAILIALFGTLGGLALGVFLGWALVKAASEGGTSVVFSAPTISLVIFFVLGALLGVVCAIRPASRAARLNILAAIGAD